MNDTRDGARGDDLAERGIWLEDASPVGIYYAGGGTLTDDRSVLNQIVREGYERFVWPEVAADAPQQVWVIGRTVARALIGLPRIDLQRVACQPSWARRAGRLDEYEADVRRLCHQLASAGL